MPAGKITALRAQAHDAQRVNVFVDDEFALGISLATITKERLYVGKVLSEEDYERLEQAEHVDKAVHAAMRFLDTRPRSIAEIRQRLHRKDFEPEAIEQALERMADLGLSNDDAFARFWVENRQLISPRGAGALRDELRRKGVERNVIDEVLSDETLTGDEATQAMQMARKSLRKYANSPDRMTFTRRMGGYLQRRGYTFDIIRPILDELWNEVQTAADDDTEANE